MVEFRQYECIVHRVHFNMLQYVLELDNSDTIVPVIDNVFTPLVILNRKLLTSELYYHIVESFKQIYSFQTVSTIIEAQWNRVLQLHLQMVRAY